MKRMKHIFTNALKWQCKHYVNIQHTFPHLLIFVIFYLHYTHILFWDRSKNELSKKIKEKWPNFVCLRHFLFLFTHIPHVSCSIKTWYRKRKGKRHYFYFMNQNAIAYFLFRFLLTIIVLLSCRRFYFIKCIKKKRNVLLSWIVSQLSPYLTSIVLRTFCYTEKKSKGGHTCWDFE